jgi:hypothetical protein
VVGAIASPIVKHRPALVVPEPRNRVLNGTQSAVFNWEAGQPGLEVPRCWRVSGVALPGGLSSGRREPYIDLAAVRFRVAQRHLGSPKRQKHACRLVGRASGVTCVQLIQKLFRRDEVGGPEALGKAVVDRTKAGDGVATAAAFAQEAGEARRGAELP